MREYYAYQIEAAGGNRYNVVRKEPTVVAQDLRWEEAVALANELNLQLEKMENPGE